jgi:hypothetical protein
MTEKDVEMGASNFGQPLYVDGHYYGVGVDPNDLTKEELVKALNWIHAGIRTEGGGLSVHYSDSNEFDCEPPDDASPEVRAEHKRAVLEWFARMDQDNEKVVRGRG